MVTTTELRAGAPLRLLLTDGSGLTARQVATQAHAAGHAVGVLSPTKLGLAGLTRHVRRLHRVPRFGEDPFGWLEATLAVLRGGHYDVLLATHEQAAVLSREADAVTETGVRLAVPPFAALKRVQDKVSQRQTLADLGLPQPASHVCTNLADLVDGATPPVYLKAPIGTASGGVRFVNDAAGLEPAGDELADGLENEGIVVQEALAGPVLMVQAVFDRGRLVAWHANLRLREGPNGGSSLKASIRPDDVEDHLGVLGHGLSWHGALSLDAVITDHGPRYIDVNPRLVEPGNAWRAGIDLVEALIAVSVGNPMPPVAAPREGVRTHQLLLAVLAAAEHGRRRVAGEALAAMAHRPPYDQSTEELTPRGGDVLSGLPVAAATIATLVWPGLRRWFTESAVSAYALTPAAWRQIASPTREQARVLQPATQQPTKDANRADQ